MTPERADAILAETLAPMTTDEFFTVVGKTCFDLQGGTAHPRRRLFGDDPKRTILDAFGTHSSELDCHAKAATQPAPTPRAVSNSDEFLALIESFHKRGYTVRVPGVISLAPELQRFARALECMIRQPVGSSLFWSTAGAQAIVHYDKRDNIIIQLEGKKRWFISTDPPGLQNSWEQVGEALPHLQRHRIVDVGPGDLIYIPRGTPHTVESTTESLHVALLFEPITLREAIIAALDYLSDHDRTFRETAISRVQDTDFVALSSQIVEGLGQLLTQSKSQDFLKAATDLRSSRFTVDLLPLGNRSARPPITRDTRVRQSPLAISHLRHSLASLDFSQPGGHIAVHPGVERELQFIASTQSFRVAEVPGGSSGDVKIALVNKLVDSGFLEVAD
jgi:bifunctional lysine-specific demethylase and histidyl-hydroxylase MINA